jgi:hypothetical protein
VSNDQMDTPGPRHRLAHEDVAGTHQGYGWHLRDGSPPCDPCTTAHAGQVQAWRDRRDPHRPVKVPLALLGELLAAVPDEVRGEFVHQLGPIAVRATAAQQAR